MTVRQDSHAGSWYTDNPIQLDSQLVKWLTAAGSQPTDPVAGLKAIIAPHAGYSYSGPTAAHAYQLIDPSAYSRVFVLGPSHHHYLDGCALSSCAEYNTPLGKLPLDKATIEQLQASGKFESMDLDVDEAEHSIEMHLPYIRKVFQGRDITIVPILVGSIKHAKEAEYGSLLAPFLADQRTLFVVSSDFCHWGTRFRYTYYKPSPGDKELNLRSESQIDGQPIHQSITDLDRQGMETITVTPPDTAREKHAAFEYYLQQTKNTICGRHPIGVLLAAVASLQDSNEPGGWATGAELQFVKYAQSSSCRTLKDSSVSYASAMLKVQ